MILTQTFHVVYYLLKLLAKVELFRDVKLSKQILGSFPNKLANSHVILLNSRKKRTTKRHV